MFKRKELNKIKKEVERFFEKMDFEVGVDVLVEEEALLVNIKANEPQILIGENGRVLAQIQKILKAILARKFSDRRFYLNLDINDYRKKKIQYLKEMAKEVGDKVALSREEIALAPMTSFERRIIHLELAEREDVITESVGYEPERKVVIKPSS